VFETESSCPRKMKYGIVSKADPYTVINFKTGKRIARLNDHIVDKVPKEVVETLASKIPGLKEVLELDFDKLWQDEIEDLEVIRKLTKSSDTISKFLDTHLETDSNKMTRYCWYLAGLSLSGLIVKNAYKYLPWARWFGYEPKTFLSSKKAKVGAVAVTTVVGAAAAYAGYKRICGTKKAAADASTSESQESSEASAEDIAASSTKVSKPTKKMAEATEEWYVTLWSEYDQYVPVLAVVAVLLLVVLAYCMLSGSAEATEPEDFPDDPEPEDLL